MTAAIDASGAWPLPDPCQVARCTPAGSDDVAFEERSAFENPSRRERRQIDVLGAVDRLPPDWDVVTLHSLFASAGPRPLPGPPLTGDFRVCTYARMPYGAQGCLVSRRAAERLLAVGRPIRFPPDDVIFRPRPARLRIYGIEPSPIVHADFGSELGVTRTDDARGIARIAARVVVAAGKVRARIHRRLDR